jgi:hypothetical protein
MLMMMSIKDDKKKENRAIKGEQRKGDNREIMSQG